MITPNKYMTWEEAVREYPDSYVVFDENAKTGWGGEPLAGLVIAACTNDEIDDFRIKCMEEKKCIHYERTSYKKGVYWG